MANFAIFVIVFSIVLVVYYVSRIINANPKNTTLQKDILTNNEDPKLYINKYRDPLEKTLKEYVQITATPATTLPIDASKFGGIPYIPVGKEWPKDKEGKLYIFIAQINMNEVPPLEDFPKTGMLQFFVPDENVWGLNFDDMHKSEYKVIYLETTSAKAQGLTLPVYKTSMISGEFALTFNKTKSYISSQDFRLESIANDTDFLEKIGYDEKNIIEETLGFPMGNNIEPKHQIGGYPYFTQWDPRDKKLKPDFSGDDESMLLFQMDSQMISGSKNEIMWGDLGVANFFITRKDLREKKFDRILYNWDCS